MKNATGFHYYLFMLYAVKNFVSGLPSLVWNLPGDVCKLLGLVAADLFVQVLILPAMGLAITLVFIRQLSKILGGYVDLGSFGSLM